MLTCYRNENDEFTEIEIPDYRELKPKVKGIYRNRNSRLQRAETESERNEKK